MTQCTRCGKENVDVHTCTPLPTTPVGGTVEGDWIEKVQRDMREMKFHCDSRYADWDTLMTEVRQSIEKHMPTPKSQEAVDVEEIVRQMAGFIDGDANTTSFDYEKAKEYLSALPIAGKKFTEDGIKKWCDESIHTIGTKGTQEHAVNLAINTG